MARATLPTLAALLALSCAAPSWAVDPLKHARDPAPGHRGLTYLDLMRQAVPGLALNVADDAIEGHLKVAVRHLAGTAAQGGGADPVTLGYIEDRRIKVGGQRRMVILADLGPSAEGVANFELMLLFTDDARPRLLDMADVGLDKDSGFSQHGVLPVGPGDDALVTYSEHDDADLTMGAYLVASTIGDRFRLVDDFYVTSAKLCGWTSIQKARFVTVPNRAEPYRRIEIAVTDAIRRTPDDECGDDKIPRPSTRAYRATYRWDAGRRQYVTVTSDLKRLEALNQRGF